ncbi:MAG: DMT family transporter [Actinobacteria bacterium]|nr:DMT family transporter [Actinomycetota bacterium]
MAAVAFALGAGLLFGLFAVVVRMALQRGGDPQLGAPVIIGTGFLTALAISAPSLAGLEIRDLLPFYLVGLFVPGASQIIFLMAVRDAGPARASVIIGIAPILSVGIALVFLDEQFDPLLALATLLVVAGGAALVFERSRPAHFRLLGAVFALTCAVMFSVRDNLVRWATQDVDPPAVAAAAASLLGAFTTVALYVLIVRRHQLAGSVRSTLRTFLPVGLVLGGAYICLVLGFDRGRVSVVAPLNATQSLWGVLFSAVLLGRSEAVGSRLVLAAALVVGGSAIVGIAR